MDLIEMITILLVEQDPSLQEKYLSLLNGLDVKTELCNRVGKAVERLRCFTYDAMIVDFGIKGLNPAQVIPVFKKISPRVPIIALMEKKNEPEKEIEKAGVFSCLTKPVNDKEFLSAIGKAINKKETIN